MNESTKAQLRAMSHFVVGGLYLLAIVGTWHALTFGSVFAKQSIFMAGIVSFSQVFALIYCTIYFCRLYYRKHQQTDSDENDNVTRVKLDKPGAGRK
jgi:hypothetical protein